MNTLSFCPPSFHLLTRFSVSVTTVSLSQSQAKWKISVREKLSVGW